MNKQTTAAGELILELISTIVDFPKDLKVEARELATGDVYWTIQPHADDYRKVCGSGGAHIKALTFIIGELGEANCVVYKTWLKEPAVGEKQTLRPIAPRDEYDPRAARDLLCRILTAVLGERATYAVNVIADGSRIEVPPFSLLYTFEIKVRDQGDLMKLDSSYDGDFENRTLATSLDEIWRAYAAKEGVAFAIKALPL